MKNLFLIVALILVSSCAHKKCGKGKGCHSKKHRFESMDTNSDGKVSRKEWTQHKGEKFDKMDANKDGFLTKEEKKAYKKKKCDGKNCKI